MTNEILNEYGNDPIALCKDWLLEATESELNDPDAICLATADAEGHPSARMVLIKEINESGFKFHTNEESQKGQELKQNPHAQMCFHWKSTRKQVRISGIIEQVPEEESDEYFLTRPTERQVGAWASQQSRPYEKREDLENAIKKYSVKFENTDQIPRPPYWKGFRLNPSAIEFWVGQRDRLHTRFRYTRQDNGSWTATWLCP